MTVQNTPSFVEYTADGIQTSFNFTFRVDDASWVLINYLVNFDTITLNLDQDASPGGSVSYTVAPPNLELIRIERATPLDQQLNYTRYDPFDSESHENALDKLTMQQQDTITAYQAADLVLTDGLAQEIIDRMAADVVLQNNIDAEAATRLGNDNTIIANYIAADAAITAAYIAADNLQQIDIDANNLLITTGGSPGHTHVLADITDYIAPVGTVPSGTVEGQFLRWNNGLMGWETTPYVFPAAIGNNGDILVTDGAGNITFQAPAGGAAVAYDVIPLSDNFTYNFLIASPPGAGEMRINNNPTLATSMFIDDTGNSGRDFGLIAANLTTGDRIVYSNIVDGATKYTTFDVTGPPVDNGGWWTVPIAYLRGSAAALVNGVTAQIEVIQEWSGGGGIAPGTVTNTINRWDGAAWTEQLGFRAVSAGTLTFEVEGSGARLKLITTGGGVDEKRTRIRMDNFAGFVIDAETDGGFNSNFLMSANRTAAVWQDLLIQTGVGISGGDLTLEGGVLVMEERASAIAAVANYGQFWVRDRTVCQPWWQDDAGVNYPLAFAVARRVQTNGSYNMNTGANDFNAINGIAIYDDGAAYTITTEDSGSLNWPIDCSFQIVARGAGVISILEGSGVTLYVDDGTGFVDSAGGCTLTNGACTVYRVSNTEVRVWGSGLTP